MAESNRHIIHIFIVHIATIECDCCVWPGLLFIILISLKFAIAETCVWAFCSVAYVCAPVLALADCILAVPSDVPRFVPDPNLDIGHDIIGHAICIDGVICKSFSNMILGWLICIHNHVNAWTK